MVITIETNSVPNNFPLHNELKEIIDSVSPPWRNELAETVRTAQSAIRTVNIADLTAAARELANAMSAVQVIDYGAELRETTRALKQAMIEAQSIHEQQAQMLQDIVAAIQRTDLESASPLADAILMFSRFIERIEDREDTVAKAEPETEYIDDETAEYLTDAIGHVQTILSPERPVPFAHLRNFVCKLTPEFAVAILGLLLQLFFGIAALSPDPQITEQNEILTGIWQEMREYNDNHAPTPTPECTSDPTAQWLST